MAWGIAGFTTSSDGALSLKAQTADGVHTYTYSTAGTTLTAPDGSLVTPNATQLTITVRYPFTATNTNLAFEVIATSINGNGPVAPKLDESQHHIIYGDSYWSWAHRQPLQLARYKQALLPAMLRILPPSLKLSWVH